MDFVREFLLQAQEANLKTSQYPREYADLRMKVSFGMGMPARVPWISFTAQEMSTSNGYYPVYLYYKEVNVLILAFGISETSEYAVNWPQSIQDSYPKISDVIENPARYGDSFVFKTYEPVIENNAVKILRDGVEVSSALIDEELSEILGIYKRTLDLEVKNESSAVSSGLFYMEKQLEDFIIENWENTQLGQQMDLIYEEGILKSQQFKTGIGPIDILAKDKKTGAYVVIELKKNQTSDDTVGQIARYMGWIKEKLDDPNVRGIIVAGKYDEKLDYARKMIVGVDVFIYEVQFNLKEYVK
jgi:Endonuclease NucS/MrcB-like, N-terminal domain